jgi:hypothetical protein
MPEMLFGKGRSFNKNIDEVMFGQSSGSPSVRSPKSINNTIGKTL